MSAQVKMILLAVLLVVGCGGKYETDAKLVENAMPDTLTVTVSHNGRFYGSVEEYALRRYPGYRVHSVRFLGIANDPDIYYEVKLVRPHPRKEQ